MPVKEAMRVSGAGQVVEHRQAHQHRCPDEFGLDVLDGVLRRMVPRSIRATWPVRSRSTRSSARASPTNVIGPVAVPSPEELIGKAGVAGGAGEVRVTTLEPVERAWKVNG